MITLLSVIWRKKNYLNIYLIAKKLDIHKQIFNFICIQMKKKILTFL